MPTSQRAAPARPDTARQDALRQWIIRAVSFGRKGLGPGMISRVDFLQNMP